MNLSESPTNPKKRLLNPGLLAVFVLLVVMAAVSVLSKHGSSDAPPETAIAASEPDFDLQLITPASVPATAPASAPSGPVVVEDVSLTEEQYVAMGFPPPDEKWSLGELAKANKALESLKRDKLASLPRYNSPRSGRIFGHFVSDENEDRINELPMPESMEYFRHLQELQFSVLMVYWHGYNMRHCGPREIIELGHAVLRTRLQLIEAYGPGFQAWTRQRDRDYGTYIICNTLDLIASPRLLSDDDIDRALTCLQSTIPKLKKYMSSSSELAVLNRLKSLALNKHLVQYSIRLQKLLGDFEYADTEEQDR